MGKLVSIDGDKNKKPRQIEYARNYCECDWPHFVWEQDEKDPLDHVLTCTRCGQFYHIYGKEIIDEVG